MNTFQSGSPMPEYSSVIVNWNSKSAVRSKPRRFLSDDDEERNFFSPDLTPAATHPLVLAHGKEGSKELLTRRLYSYLDFTIILEQEIVNPVVLRLSRDTFGIALPSDMKFDAYRIYCDEAYHALFSLDIKRQVEACTGILSAGNFPEPYFCRAIRQVRASLPPNLSGLVDLCAAVVSETLISGSLTKIPSDPTVVEAIRETISDHAADERTHHAYFTKVLEIAWPQIDGDTQRSLSPHFADFILAFLIPDEEVLHWLLGMMGFGRDDARQILHDSHPLNKTVADARHAARSTIRLLQRTGILDDGRTRDHFTQLRLID